MPKYTVHICIEAESDEDALIAAHSLHHKLGRDDEPYVTDFDDWAEAISTTCMEYGRPASYQLFRDTPPSIVEVPHCAGPLASTGSGRRTCLAHRQAHDQARAHYEAQGHKSPVKVSVKAV